MNAAVCACGRRLESDTASSGMLMAALVTGSHSPDRCSRDVGFQASIDGRVRMVDQTMAHLTARATLGGAELAEIRLALLEIARRP